jgi:mono/diheme cytochrome c family protein
MDRKHIGGLMLAGLLSVCALPVAAQAPAAPPLAVVGGKFTMKDGEQVYKQVCSGCHMPDGKGASGAGTYPALAGNPKLGSPAYPAMVIIRGQKGMPPFGSLFEDQQIAEVVNYVRGHFGNSFPGSITAADVRAMR